MALELPLLPVPIIADKFFFYGVRIAFIACTYH